MHMAILPPDYNIVIKKKHLSDVLDDRTHKHKRMLLLFAMMSIIAKVYNLQLVRLPWINIDAPNDAPYLFTGALAILLVYFLIQFSVSAISDFVRWNIEKEEQHYRSIAKNVQSATDFISNLSLKDATKNIADQFASELHSRSSQLTHHLVQMDRSFTMAKLFGAFRLYILELMLPVVLSIYALILVARDGWVLILNLL